MLLSPLYPEIQAPPRKDSVPVEKEQEGTLVARSHTALSEKSKKMTVTKLLKSTDFSMF